MATKTTTRPRTRTRAAAPTRPVGGRRPAGNAKAKGRDPAPFADIGVPSPYALAEAVSRRRIDWDSVPDRPAVLEEIFQMPYQDLFDPANGSPLYVGQHLRADGSVERKRPDFAEEREGDDPEPDLSDVRTLADLVERFGTKQLADVPVRNLVEGATGHHVELGESPSARFRRFRGLFDLELIDTLFPFLTGYHPPGYSWTDNGRFYNEATEFSDPVQGQVGDCYLIAALSSVAWAMPHEIVDRNRATGTDNERFKHQIGFHGANGVENVEVTDNVLVTSGGWTHFARSKEAGEIWPAVYEKAYAKWRLGEMSDFPAIPNIAGGDPSIACAALTGLSDYRNWHQWYDAGQILQLVKDHTSNGRTTTPMVSWTHGSGPAADVAYTDANVVAGHAYSVLGWMQRTEYTFGYRLEQIDIPHWDWPIPGPGPDPFVHASSPLLGSSSIDARRLRRMGIDLSDFRLRSRKVDYIVLRNPWGYFEGTGSSVASGDHKAVDVDWWRTIPLGVDGVFAMEVNAYHRYFAGTGGAH